MQEREPMLQSLRVGSCLTFGSEFSQADTCAEKARGFIGKGCLGEEQESEGTQEDCSATWLAASGFTVIKWVSRLPLANHCDSGSILVVHALLCQDGFQRGGFWEVGRPRGIYFWPFLSSSSLWWFVSSMYLNRISHHKITHSNGYSGAWPGRRFQPGFPWTTL